MHGEFVSNFLVIMLSQVKMLLWEFFIIPRSVLKGFLYFMSLSVNCDACVCKINCQICFFFCGKTHWITVSFLNIETQRASLYRIVFTARVIIFAIECLLLKVSISSLGVGYFADYGDLFLKVKVVQELYCFAGPEWWLRIVRTECYVDSYFLRGPVDVIFNLHNFMLSTKQNITYQNK